MSTARRRTTSIAPSFLRCSSGWPRPTDHAKAYQYRDNPHHAGGYAYAAYREQRYAEAQRRWMKCLQFYHKLAARNPAAFRSDVAGMLNNFGILYRDAGRDADAEMAVTEPAAFPGTCGQADRGGGAGRHPMARLHILPLSGQLVDGDEGEGQERLQCRLCSRFARFVARHHLVRHGLPDVLLTHPW